MFFEGSHNWEGYDHLCLIFPNPCLTPETHDVPSVWVSYKGNRSEEMPLAGRKTTHATEQFEHAASSYLCYFSIWVTPPGCCPFHTGLVLGRMTAIDASSMSCLCRIKAAMLCAWLFYSLCVTPSTIPSTQLLQAARRDEHWRNCDFVSQ